MDTVELACCLIGKVVVHDTDSGRLIGPIVETEGHPVGDAAGHAYASRCGSPAFTARMPHSPLAGQATNEG